MIDAEKRILTLGIGGAGCNTVSRIAPLAPSGMDFAIMDSDAQTLSRSPQIEKSILIGKSITDGMSAGGDDDIGRRCAEKNSSYIEGLLAGVDLLIVVVGLGGGLGTGAAPVVARMAQNAGVYTLFFAIFPFDFEGRVIRKKAQDGLRKLRTYTDAIVQMPNKRIQPDGEALWEDSLDRSCQTLSEGVIGLWRLLAYRGICNLDYASLHTMLRYCDATCRFSCASASGFERVEELVEGLRSHPLAGQGDIFEKTPGMIIGITGGEDLKLSEAQYVLEQIAPDNETCWVKMGVAIDPSFTGRLSAMVLTAESWKTPLVDDGHGGLIPATREGAQQGELAGLLTPRSRTFGGSERTIWRGEDLDIPTFIRRKIKLPR